MAGFSTGETRRKAIRDFLAHLAVSSAVSGAVVYFFTASPEVPEPLKSGIVVAVAIAWVLAALGMAQSLRRDLTPVRLLEGGIRAGRRFVPYGVIAEVDPQLGVRVFGLRLQGRKLALYLSKIGVSDENAFFEELNRRIMGTRHAAENGSSPARRSVDIES